MNEQIENIITDLVNDQGVTYEYAVAQLRRAIDALYGPDEETIPYGSLAQAEYNATVNEDAAGY